MRKLPHEPFSLSVLKLCWWISLSELESNCALWWLLWLGACIPMFKRPFMFVPSTDYGEVDITITVAKGNVCVSSPHLRCGDKTLWWASSCNIGVKHQLVDRRLISMRRPVGLMNLMLSHAHKWHEATLRVQIVNSMGISINKEGKTYAVWQMDNGIYCAITLKEVAAVWIVVLTHELNILCCSTRVTTCGNLPPCGIGDIWNQTGRTPLCMNS